MKSVVVRNIKTLSRVDTLYNKFHI